VRGDDVGVGVRVGTGVAVVVELGEGVKVGLSLGETIPQADENMPRLMSNMTDIT
jgi:hypothetical protein